MTDARVDDLLHLLETEDPLEVGRVRWSATRLEDRRYSLIYRVVPRAEAERVRERAGGEELVLKVYRAAQPARRQQEFDDLRRVWEALGPGAGVVRPVACWADRGAIVTLRARGSSLGRLVRRACRRTANRTLLAQAAALCTTAGTWLQVFQTEGRRQVRNERPSHLANPDDFLEYVSERLTLLPGLVPPVDRVLCRRLVAHAAAALHALPARTWGTVTWSHSDFGPHNLLADGDAVTVLDFELQPQHPYFDLAYFVESLAHAAGPQAELSRVVRLERAFLAGYGGEIDPPLLALFRLRHLACTYVSEARRRGIAQVRAIPGLLALRERLRRLPEEISPRSASRAA